MSLTFVGPSGSSEHRWISWPLLRDCVQHHLGGERLSNVLRLTDALGSREGVYLPARAVTEVSWTPDSKTTQTELATAGGGVPAIVGGSPHTLRDVFGSVVFELLRISQGADEQAQVRIIDS